MYANNKFTNGRSTIVELKSSSARFYSVANTYDGGNVNGIPPPCHPSFPRFSRGASHFVESFLSFPFVLIFFNIFKYFYSLVSQDFMPSPIALVCTRSTILLPILSVGLCMYLSLYLYTLINFFPSLLFSLLSL